MKRAQHPRKLVRSAGVSGFSALAVVLAAACVSTVTAAPAAEDEYGTIKGRVVWAGGAPPQPEMLKVDKDPQVCGTEPVPAQALVVDPKTKGIGNAFVYLVNPVGTNPEAEKALLARASELEIDQKRCQFIPYSTAMHQNATLVLKSSDATNHNVHLTALKNASLNQMLPQGGTLKVKLVAENRPVSLTCDIHSWMKGWIMVFNHPFFAVTKEDGSFEIQGVPKGDQTLAVRLADGRYVITAGDHTQVVKVEAGKTTEVEIPYKP
jgi:hypothetical protein